MSVYVSPIAGTRNVPTDNLIFTRGANATFKITFTSNGMPIKVDNSTTPQVRIRQPAFIDNVVAGVPVGIDNIITTIQGSLVAGQEYEYEFIWNVPAAIIPSDEYIISYEATIGSMFFEYGSELFTITAGPGIIGVRQNYFATVDDVRSKKFNIDDYLPKVLAKDIDARNKLIESHLRDATDKLREELNLTQARSNSVNYRLFTVYYTVWSILLASRGEDGSSVSDSNLATWRAEWEVVLEQEKRYGIFQGLPMGRG